MTGTETLVQLSSTSQVHNLRWLHGDQKQHLVRNLYLDFIEHESFWFFGSGFGLVLSFLDMKELYIMIWMEIIYQSYLRGVMYNILCSIVTST